ncbi:MAG: hypothetical protein KAT48_10420 [Bacteroidales bacterium]|nr:hypothetical protein [Bacteroidales bacterium]
MKERSSSHNLFHILSLLTLILLVSCSSTSYLEIDVLRPAEITLPEDVQTLGIIDRSHLYEPDTLLADIIDDEPDQDRFQETNILAKESINGLLDVLYNSPRFSIKVMDSLNLDVDDMADNFSPYEWDQMLHICEDSLVDALVALTMVDVYDPLYVNVNIGGEIIYNYVIMTLNAWKLYDPYKQQIIDDYQYVDTIYQDSEGDLFGMIFSNNQPDRQKYVPEASFYAGQTYGFRITPVWYSETRKFYSWAGEASKKATILASYGSWQSAASIWNIETENKNKKIAAKACYNMALASEIQDNLPMASYWLEKSNTLRPHKATKFYIEIITMRMRERMKLDPQMGVRIDN